MTQKNASVGLLEVFVAAAPLTMLLFAQCGSAAITGASVQDDAVIIDLGAGDSASPPADAMPEFLGSAGSFAVLGGQTVTSTGGTGIVGNLGVSPGTALTGFAPGSVTAGMMHAGDAVALQAQLDLTVAYNALRGKPCLVDLTGQELSGLTLKPGVYCFMSSAAIALPTHLVLDAQDDPNAVFIFQIGSTLTAANNTAVRVINGGSVCNVYWQVGSSATIGTGASFAGNILALASVTLVTGASVSGRVLARDAAVTMDSNDVSFATCAAMPATMDMAVVDSSEQIPASPDSTVSPNPTVDVVSQPNRRLAGGGFGCSATGAGTSPNPLFWVSMLGLAALTRRREPRNWG